MKPSEIIKGGMYQGKDGKFRVVDLITDAHTFLSWYSPLPVVTARSAFILGKTANGKCKMETFCQWASCRSD